VAYEAAVAGRDQRGDQADHQGVRLRVYVLTLGLFALVVNAALLMLTSALAGELDLPSHVQWFWPAFWGAIIAAVVSWLLNLFVVDD
jgi:uncharacterized membrane protein YvlD (DUF360 family)